MTSPPCPVHQCYVRATVGTERMDAFSMAVRKPEPGDVAKAERIRSAASSYVTAARDVAAAMAEADRQADDPPRRAGRPGRASISRTPGSLPRSTRGAPGTPSPRSRRPMATSVLVNLTRRVLPVMRRLAAMPLLDRLELAAVSGTPDRTAYDIVDALEREGLVASILHATDLLRSTRRYRLTAEGLRSLARGRRSGDGRARSARTPSPPSGGASSWSGSTRWASSTGWPRPSPPRRGPSGCAGTGPRPWTPPSSSPTAGPLASSGRGSRRTERGSPSVCGGCGRDRLPGAVVFLMPDEVRLRQARRALVTARPCQPSSPWSGTRPGQSPSEPVWRLPSVAAALDLRYVLFTYLEPGGRLTVEPEPSRADHAG